MPGIIKEMEEIQDKKIEVERAAIIGGPPPNRISISKVAQDPDEEARKSLKVQYDDLIKKT